MDKFKVQNSKCKVQSGLVLLVGILIAGCAPQIPSPLKRITISSVAEPVPISASYIKINAPPADSNRAVYLDGCYIGTIASIDSIGVFTGPHSISFLSEWEKKYYSELLNYRTFMGTRVYTGEGDKIIMIATYKAFLQPGQIQTFYMNYRDVEAAIAAAGERDWSWLVVPGVLGLIIIAVGAIIIGSGS